MVEPNATRIILLGKTGAGKSSLANTIFKEKLFKVFSGFESGTRLCQAKTKSVSGRKITLIDTPGFFDTDRSEEELKQEIVRCITECSPGPHAFLIVLKLEKFTTQEEAVIHRITQYFSEDVYKYTSVVFTHGHELTEGKTIQDLVKQKKSVSDFIEKCGGRCHVIDNKLWNSDPEDKYRSNEYQVEEILQSIEKTVEANNGDCYTNEMLQTTEELIQQEGKCIAETSENMSEKEIRRKAKNRVNSFFIQAAGITTGALLGALFGGALPVVLVTKTIAGVAKAAAGAAARAVGAAAAAVRAVGAAGTTRATGAAAATGATRAGVAATTGGTRAAGVTGAAAGATAAEATGASVAEGAAGAAGEAGAEAGGTIGTGLTAGGVVVGVLAAVGAGFGGYEGHQAAQTAETPWEAAEMSAKAVCSKGLKAVKGAYNLASDLDKLLDKKD